MAGLLAPKVLTLRGLKIVHKILKVVKVKAIKMFQVVDSIHNEQCVRGAWCVMRGACACVRIYDMSTHRFRVPVFNVILLLSCSVRVVPHCVPLDVCCRAGVFPLCRNFFLLPGRHRRQTRRTAWLFVPLIIRLCCLTATRFLKPAIHFVG
jgi:hypothetical protein